MVTYFFSCLYTKCSYKNVNKKSWVIPCEQQVLIELAINSGDFWRLYVMFQRENHFINKRLQKPRRLNLKCIPAVNNVNKTNRNRYNSQS
jgi:hypothetical protein